MKNENTNKSHPFDLENQFDKRLKAYKKILQQQRDFCKNVLIYILIIVMHLLLHLLTILGQNMERILARDLSKNT